MDRVQIKAALLRCGRFGEAAECLPLGLEWARRGDSAATHAILEAEDGRYAVVEIDRDGHWNVAGLVIKAIEVVAGNGHLEVYHDDALIEGRPFAYGESHHGYLPTDALMRSVGGRVVLVCDLAA